ncbi:hypothetical protein BJ742DRAFT_790743 [Cladochytrium replicatum]|nr:hypothetical protein BJ742DRAFT_790743 [Cladochytrium replicatum]
MIYPDAELVRQLFKDSPTRNESDKLDPLPHPSHQRPQFSGLNRFGERIRRPLSDSQRTDELYQHVTSIPPSREPQQSQYRQRLFQVVPDRFPADLAEDLRCLTVGKLAVPTNQSTSQLLQQVKTGAVNTSEIERSLHSLIIGTFSIEIARLHEKVNSGGSQLREELRELGESEGRRMLKELFRSVGYRAAGTGKQQTPKVQQTAKPFGRDFADAFRAQCAKS